MEAAEKTPISWSYELTEGCVKEAYLTSRQGAQLSDLLINTDA